MTQAQDSPETLELPRTFPAWLGAWLAIIGIYPVKVLVLVSFGTSVASQDSMLLALAQLLILVMGGALSGHLAQFLCEGNRLRLGRILAAALLFDLLFVSVCNLLAG